MNDWLAKGLGTGEISALAGEKLDASGTSEGAEGRLMILDEPVSVKELVSRVKRHLGLSQGKKSFVTGGRFHWLMYALSSSSISFRRTKRHSDSGDMCRVRRIYARWTRS